MATTKKGKTESRAARAKTARRTKAPAKRKR